MIKRILTITVVLITLVNLGLLAKLYFSRNSEKMVYSFNVEEYDELNRAVDYEDYSKNAIYFYDVSTCAGCMDVMNKSLSVVASYDDSRIDFVFIYSNREEIEQFMYNIYSHYLDRINFYYISDTKYGKMDVSYTPALYIFQNSRFIKEFKFISDADPAINFSNVFFK